MTNTNMTFKNLNDFLNRASKLGEDEAKGALKRPEFARQLCVAASEGLVNLDKKNDHARKAWQAFRNKAAKTLADGNIPEREKSEDVRVSECNALIKASMNPDQIDFVDVITRAMPMISQESRAEGKVKGNLWDNYVKLARFQMKAENKTKTLSDAQIMEALAPAREPKEVNEEKLLDNLIKQMEKIFDGTSDAPANDGQGREGFPSDELEKAIALVKKRQSELRAISLRNEYEAKLAALQAPKKAA